jgi:hypothetical protein
MLYYNIFSGPQGLRIGCIFIVLIKDDFPRSHRINRGATSSNGYSREKLILMSLAKGFDKIFILEILNGPIEGPRQAHKAQTENTNFAEF